MVFCPTTRKRTSKCKVKGITLNYNSEVVNFTSVRSMILEDDTPLHVHNPRKIKRKHCGVVVSEPETKSTRLSLRSAGLWTTLTPSHMAIIRVLYLYRILFIRLFIYRSVYLYRILFIHIFIYLFIYLFIQIFIY